MKTKGTNGSKAATTELTYLLESSARTTQETIEIGNETEIELKKQREYLEDAHDKIGVIDMLVSSTKSIVYSMRYETYRKKFCLWLIIIVLFGMNLLLIVKMLRNGGKLY